MLLIEEFVAHSLSVNCLKIGRKSSRVLVTGGEDHKVNLWAIGKPNAILSLSGHSSGIDSVSFDSSEVLVAGGAASGTIKLWDLEEAKIIRTLTGHRSNCISLDFHPFGEFFASGSLDTNLKIWDIRRKGCIHTYKGHTRGVNAIRFTPDGRWVVSGGEDNTVKLWDLTAGKLLHDFKCHEGQIQCIDFHPHEFLLATGSADRTVKFWDLETFELIGSTGPESTGVRCMTFNPDGRTLLCGLHENLKVFSWEPIRSHDTVDVGWSKLSDMNVHEGKLLGCSYNQSCVGVWVVDISRIEPYAMGSTARLNGDSDSKSNSGGSTVLTEDNVKANLGRLSISHNSESVKETRSFTRLSVQQNSDLNKDSKSIPSTASTPCTPQRSNFSGVPKTTQINSAAVANATNPKRQAAKVQSTASVFNRSDVIPVVVPRNSQRLEQASESRKEDVPVKTVPLSYQSKTSELRKFINARDDLDRPVVSAQSDNELPKATDFSVPDRIIGTSVKSSVSGVAAAERKSKDDKPMFSRKVDTNATIDALARYQHESYTSPCYIQGTSHVSAIQDELRGNTMNTDTSHVEGQKGGIATLSSRTHSMVSNFEHKGRNSYRPGLASSNVSGKLTALISVYPGFLTYVSLYEAIVQNSLLRICNVAPWMWLALAEKPLGSIPVYWLFKCSSYYTLQRSYPLSDENESVSASDEDTIADLMELHDQFVSSMKSRLNKLQFLCEKGNCIMLRVFYANQHAIFFIGLIGLGTNLEVALNYWQRHDIKGAVSAISKMGDHSVVADVMSLLAERIDMVTLDICSCLLPLLSGLIESDMDRHQDIALEVLLKLVRLFGSVIYSSLSAPSSVGVDIEAEQRLERCNLCYVELEKVKGCLPVLSRRGGSIAKSAHELNLALQEVS
ncbi:UNVERIFIED_CONTAM: Katanin p80 WD40 repeat-containing subunit B1 [Sesamum radiatum]|uniref:Katanin p80 WD40 repeat-containing subunit B1 homolog n=1 Tax=Sesamum radiatum TaxID=300843 RepID=A0AAW2TZZ9_SESRA